MAPAPGEEASLAMATVVQVCAQTGVASRCEVAVRGAASGITRAAVFAEAGMALSFQGQLDAGARRAHRGDARNGGCGRSSEASAGGSVGTEVYAQPRGWILPEGRSTEGGGAEAGEVPGAFRRLGGIRGGELPANMAVCSGGRRWPCLAGDSSVMLAGSPRGQALFLLPEGSAGWQQEGSTSMPMALRLARAALADCFAEGAGIARNGPLRRVPGLRAAESAEAAATGLRVYVGRGRPCGVPGEERGCVGTCEYHHRDYATLRAEAGEWTRSCRSTRGRRGFRPIAMGGGSTRRWSLPTGGLQA
jgi:hypothetical protein